MKKLIKLENFCAKYCYLLKTPEGGFGGLPEAPKSFRDLAIENIEFFMKNIPQHFSAENMIRFLKAAKAYVEALPSHGFKDLKKYSDEELTVMAFFNKPVVEIQGNFSSQQEVLNIELDEVDDVDLDVFWDRKFREWLLSVTCNGAVFRTLEN